MLYRVHLAMGEIRRQFKNNLNAEFLVKHDQVKMYFFYNAGRYKQCINYIKNSKHMYTYNVSYNKTNIKQYTVVDRMVTLSPMPSPYTSVLSVL